MNNTLEKLKRNPHYKLSQKQLDEYTKETRQPMVEFGGPNVHNDSFAKHEVEVKRKNRKFKKQDE